MNRLLLVFALLFPSLAWSQQPNILVVVADDLDWATFNATPGLSAIAAQGMTFNGITPSPLCAPSRASMLTGLHTHNHGIKGNSKSKYNSKWYENVLGNTLADWCQDVGYHTLMVGKYANAYDKLDKTGWSSWIDPIGRGEKSSGEFWHDTMVSNAIADINQNLNKPIVVWYSSTMPHGPLIPSPDHKGSLSGITAPRGPAFNEEDVSDKVGEASILPPLTEEDIIILDNRFRLRAEMTKSIITGINQLVSVLNNRPLYIFFVSDNGYMQGQHRFKKGKGQPYEESVKTPMFVIGPNIPANTTSSALVYVADIAPTIGELCQATVPEVDTKSLTPLFTNPTTPWRNRVLLEHGWHAIVTPTRKLIRFNNGRYELYRFATDPAELQNSYTTPVPSLENYLNRLLACSGAECWNIERESS